MVGKQTHVCSTTMYIISEKSWTQFHDSVLTAHKFVRFRGHKISTEFHAKQSHEIVPRWFVNASLKLETVT